MSFDWQYAWTLLPILGPALLVTVKATAAGMAIALTAGLALALARRASRRWISLPAAGVVEFVRSTPLLVQLYFVFYVLPGLGLTLGPFAAGSLALGIHYAAYCSEVYRAGIESVPGGQWDAAYALNMGPADTLARVIIPQAVARVVPALGNYLVAMFKDTPLLSAITVVELLQTAKIAGAESFRYVEPLTLVGLAVLVRSLVSAAGIRALEARFAPVLRA
jgi:polar amino acid transport system permease protein